MANSDGNKPLSDESLAEFIGAITRATGGVLYVRTISEDEVIVQLLPKISGETVAALRGLAKHYAPRYKVTVRQKFGELCLAKNERTTAAD